MGTPRVATTGTGHRLESQGVIQSFKFGDLQTVNHGVHGNSNQACWLG